MLTTPKRDHLLFSFKLIYNYKMMSEIAILFPGPLLFSIIKFVFICQKAV